MKLITYLTFGGQCEEALNFYKTALGGEILQVSRMGDSPMEVAPNLKNKIMHAQLITYQLNDISQAEYLKQMVEPDAPILANVKGLISKVWLADEEKNTFGGFYLWENKAAMDDFMHSELVKAVVSRPFVKNVSSVDFEVNQTASLITRGLK